MTVGRAVAVVVRADSVLVRVAVGAGGDGAKVEVFGSGGAGHAEGESVCRVAVDAVGTAAGFAGDGAGGGGAGSGGCEAGGGGEAEEDCGELHCDGRWRCLVVKYVVVKRSELGMIVFLEQMSSLA